jgi:hypothetical protein
VDGDQRPIGSRFLSLWAARITRPQREKTIDICFLGQRNGYDDRTPALNRLAEAGIKIAVSGGRREQLLSFQDYMETLDNSLIALNFSKTKKGVSQLKARVFEALASHCCLVEDRNPVTSLYLTPGVHFVAWNDPVEMVEVVRELLSDRERATRIAIAGQRAFEARYSARCFWDRIVGSL